MGLELVKTADGTGLVVKNAPVGTATIQRAASTAQAAGTTVYGDYLYPLAAPLKAPDGQHLWLSGEPRDVHGQSLGAWTPRILVSTTPPPPPPPPVTLFTPGLVLNGDPLSNLTVAGINAVAAKTVRAELGITTDVSSVRSLQSTLSAHGAVLQPLAGANSRIPTSTEAKGLAAWAIPGVKLIEFLNETNYPGHLGMNVEAARYYAIRCKEAAEALAPHGVGLTVQASDAGSRSSAWIDAMFAAVPDLHKHVAGWTIHPYTSANFAGGTDGWGIPMMERMVASLAMHGDTTLPIDITEEGIPTDDGRTLSDGKHYTFDEAAAALPAHCKTLREKAHGRVRSYFVYCGHDLATSGATTNREEYFGVVNSSAQPKGAFTPAIKSLLAST